MFYVTDKLYSRVVTCDKGGSKCDWSRLSVCLFVCLSVSKITHSKSQTRLDGFGCRDMDELINF